MPFGGLRRRSARGFLHAGGESRQSAVVRDVQNKIALRLNASVELRHSAKKGKIIIEYLGNDDLQRYSK